MRESLEQQTATSEVLRSSVARPSELHRCSTRCSKMRRGICECHVWALARWKEMRSVSARARPAGRISKQFRRTGSLQPYGRWLNGATARNAAAGAHRRLSARDLLPIVIPIAVARVELGGVRHHSPRSDAQRGSSRSVHLAMYRARSSTVHRQANRVGSRTSPSKPSSLSRTPGCSTNCANRWSSRPRPPRFCRSSQFARRA